jgi:hypothetical protein
LLVARAQVAQQTHLSDGCRQQDLGSFTSTGDTIFYDQDCTTTRSAPITVDKDLTIESSGHTVILDGNNAVTVLIVKYAVPATIATVIGLTFQHGNGASALGDYGGSTQTFPLLPGSPAIDAGDSPTCTAVDDGSGLASNSCADISGSAESFGPGSHSVSASATDALGNSTTVSTTFTVDVTTANLIDLTTQYVANNQAARLLAAPFRLVTLAERLGSPQLKAIAVNIYIVFVRFQEGHILTAQQVATLTQLARNL